MEFVGNIFRGFLKYNMKQLRGINMEESISLSILHSAPQSECEDSEELTVISSGPSILPSPLPTFSSQNMQFSPVGISTLSSPNFIELLLATRRDLLEQKEKSLKKSRKPKKKSTKTKLLCVNCRELKSSYKILDCKCVCNNYLDCPDCYELYCNNKIACSCSVMNEIPDSNNSSVLIENANISKHYSKAMWVLSIIDMLSDSELDQQQRLLINVQSTLVVKVKITIDELAWEVPCEFTVKDLMDLIEMVTKKRGEIFCNGELLDTRFMLGFVRLYIWRKNDMLTVELIEDIHSGINK